MNQKGEVTLMASLLLFILLGIVLLCSLELKKSYYQLQKRTELFLCVKEVKGELNEFIKLTGKTNWAIKNLNRAEIIMMFIPMGQASAMNTKKLKSFLIKMQEARLISYLKRLKEIESKGCKLDLRMLLTPFELSFGNYKRDREQAVILREKRMELFILFKTVFSKFKNKFQRMGKSFTQHNLCLGGENGDSTVSLATCLLICSTLLISLIWLNKYFETKTKEHLNDFRKDWNYLEEKYQE